MKYSVARLQAETFANEMNQTVYIAKAQKNNHCRILFNEKEIEKYKNHKIYEAVNPKVSK